MIFLGLAGLFFKGIVLPDQFKHTPFTLFCLFLLCSGVARYTGAASILESNAIVQYNDDGRYYAIHGWIEDIPDERDNNIQIRLNVQLVELEGLDFKKSISGLVLARLPLVGEWHYGDQVIVRGRLETPPEDPDFSYKDYLARQNIHNLVRNGEAELVASGQGNGFRRAIFTLKENLLDLVYRFCPDPEASLAAGILLGVKSGIPENVEQAFQDTGTSHIIAISGFNITIVAGLFFACFSRWFGQNWGRGLALAGIIVYVLLVGADPAVVRAAIMGGFGLLARHVGRRQMGVNTLLVTTAIMAFWNPLVLWDVDFQLSFAAVLGLILYAEPLENWFADWATKRLSEENITKLARPVSEYFLLTIVAQITTLPLIVYHFQRLSLTSLPANLAILPAQPPVITYETVFRKEIYLFS